jgi:hypothetical protein
LNHSRREFPEEQRSDFVFQVRFNLSTRMFSHEQIKGNSKIDGSTSRLARLAISTERQPELGPSFVSTLHIRGPA